MALFGKARELKSLQTELTGLRAGCGMHAKVPAANQRRAEIAFPRDINGAVDRAVRAGHAAEARELLIQARSNPPTQTGGLDYDGIIGGALGRISG